MFGMHVVVRAIWTCSCLLSYDLWKMTWLSQLQECLRAAEFRKGFVGIYPPRINTRSDSYSSYRGFVTFWNDWKLPHENVVVAELTNYISTAYVHSPLVTLASDGAMLDSTPNICSAMCQKFTIISSFQFLIFIFFRSWAFPVFFRRIPFLNFSSLPFIVTKI